MSTLFVVRCTWPSAVMSLLRLPTTRSAVIRTTSGGRGVAPGDAFGETANVCDGCGPDSGALPVVGYSSLFGAVVAKTGGGGDGDTAGVGEFPEGADASRPDKAVVGQLPEGADASRPGTAAVGELPEGADASRPDKAGVWELAEGADASRPGP